MAVDEKHKLIADFEVSTCMDEKGILPIEMRRGRKRARAEHERALHDAYMRGIEHGTAARHTGQPHGDYNPFPPTPYAPHSDTEARRQHTPRSEHDESTHTGAGMGVTPGIRRT